MELYGNGFTLRDWFDQDAASLAKNANNPNIASCLFDRFPHPYTLDAATEWIGHRKQQDPMANFAVASPQNEVIGGIGLEFRPDVYRKTPLLGYWLAEPYWGKGIMPAAVKLVTAYAFEKLDVICIVANAFGKNPRSMRVLEKAGFEKQGIIKQSAVKNGEILDEHVYALHSNRTASL